MRSAHLTVRNRRDIRWSRRLGALASAAVVTTSMFVAVGTNALAAAASTPHGTPIAIGDICDCTGALAAGEVQTTSVARAWVAWVNAHGGLDGHPAKLFYSDTQLNPGVAVTDAENLIQKNHVAVIFDNSSVDSVWIGIATSAGVPVIGGITSGIDYTSKDFFATGSTDNYGMAGQDAGAATKGVKTQAIFYCVESPQCAVTERSAVPVGTRVGIKLVYNVGISYSAPSYAAQCLAAQQAGAESLAIFDGSAIVQKVADDCGTQGYHPVIIETTGETGLSMATDANFKKLIASQNDIPWFVHNAATKDFYTALDKYAPTLLSSPNYGESAIVQWADGILLQNAITAAAPSQGTKVTGAVVKKGLYNLPTGDTLGGLAAQAIHFTKGVPANYNCWFYMSVSNGQFVWANNHKPLCPPLMAPGSQEGGPVLKKK